MKKISKPFYPALSSNKAFITSLVDIGYEQAFWLTAEGVTSVNNYGTDPQQILFNHEEAPPNSILLHTHLNMDSPHLTDSDIKSSQTTKIPVAVWHTAEQKLDFYDPDFPHPYPLTIKSQFLGWQDFLNLPGSAYRCNCYTLSANIAKVLFDLSYPEWNFYNVDHISVFKNPSKFGFTEVKGTPQEGDLAILYISPEIPHHLAQVFTIDSQKKEPLSIHIIGGKHRSELLNLERWKNNVISYWRVNPVSCTS